MSAFAKLLSTCVPRPGWHARVALPELGLDVRFPGGSREESQELLEDWLRGLQQTEQFDKARLHVSYVFGEDYNAVSAGLGFNF